MSNVFIKLGAAAVIAFTPASAYAGGVRQGGNTTANLAVITNTAGAANRAVSLTGNNNTGIYANLKETGVTGNLDAGNFANLSGNTGLVSGSKNPTVQQGGTLNNNQYSLTNTSGAQNRSVAIVGSNNSGLVLEAPKASVGGSISLGNFGSTTNNAYTFGN